MKGQSNDERDYQASQSRDCPHCGGNGLATVYRPEYQGRAVEQLQVVRGGGEVEIEAVVVRTVAHCCCPLGQWMRSNVGDDARRRIPDVITILAGRSLWDLRDPTEADWLGRVRTWEEMRRMIGRGEGVVVRTKNGVPV